jgi:hypothetical protein
MTLTYAPSPEVSLLRLTASPRNEADERKLDQVLADSFPASDPPPWTLGRADQDHSDQAVTAAASARADSSRDDERAWFCYATDVVVAAGNRTGWQRLISGIGAVGVAMLVPIGILAIGLPIALAVRALLEVAGWLAAMVLR